MVKFPSQYLKQGYPEKQEVTSCHGHVDSNSWGLNGPFLLDNLNDASLHTGQRSTKSG